VPELPEVETVRRTLIPVVRGRTVAGVTVGDARSLKNATPAELARALTGAEVTGVLRRGKYLIWELSDGHRVVFHLRMTGQLVHTDPDEPEAKHTCLRIGLSDGGEVRFVDTRHLGTIHLLPPEDGRGSLQGPPGLVRLGPEPLAPDLDEDAVYRELQGRRRQIKALLLDQTFLAGVGNIYADEALHLAGIHPERPAGTLDRAEARRLLKVIRHILSAAIRQSGTSVSDYVDGEGRRGRFQLQLRVYGRRGEACPDCGDTVDRVKVGGRSSYFCPRCQPAPQGGVHPEAAVDSATRT